MVDRNGHSAAYPDRAIEWLFTALMLAWGGWLLMPWDTFKSPQYALLAAIAGESVWGAWSVSIGLIRAAALYVNGAHRRTPAIRAFCAMLGFVWWLVLAYLFLTMPGAPPFAGFSWYPVLMVFEVMCIWRSAADGYHSRAFTRRAANAR
ncbi:hypothetical protein AOPFMNJM_1661 [Methylobacterium jeotgali]|uniref:Transmembrane protein n=2 Tax=Pseudomonadota TaxID=1224 RepID=A0ABQ4ST15_9HYPH|nr:hypothetical protein [Methylobacterium jeotgali]GJE06345.1 hypothetical protein AOPFMNJM_1661 [Methylobacterium jeotgali]